MRHEIIMKSVDIMRVNSMQELESAAHNNHASHLLLTHENITVGEHDLRLMQTALTQLPPNSAVISRVFDNNAPYWLANAGYWQDSYLMRWHILSMAEHVEEVNEPVLAAPYLTSIGAVLLSRDSAVQVGFFDPRFRTSLCDIEWLMRAKRLGVKCVLVRNSRVFQNGESCNHNMTDIYGTTHDGLLLERAMGILWPFRLLRQFILLVRDVWRPFDFYLDREHAFLRRWFWAANQYLRGVSFRINSQESRDLLRAMKDFIWLIAFSRTRMK